MKNLPIGIQTFSEIINNNYLYVDKTRIIEKLIKSGKYFFLSRPRRFGKSLLLSTLKEVFSGNKELFKGLNIYNNINWEVSPIILISFSSITYSQTREVFENEIISTLINIGRKHNVDISGTTVISVFNKLIEQLSKINQVVILIDEYDKPIIDFLNNLDKAKENREVLRQFYASIKDNDPNIRFCMLTGVSKFSKVSVFSGLNNLKDITINEEYSTICGITQIELNNYFDDRIPSLAEKHNLTSNELKLKIKEWYNGYSWDGTNAVYNPFSILNFFDDGQFKNYWFSSGTPSFLIEKFKQGSYNIEEINNFSVTDSFFDSFDIDTFDYRSLLFQTGYLTLTNLDFVNMIYTLGYPNKEVKESFFVTYIYSFCKNSTNRCKVIKYSN